MDSTEFIKGITSNTPEINAEAAQIDLTTKTMYLSINSGNIHKDLPTDGDEYETVLVCNFTSTEAWLPAGREIKPGEDLQRYWKIQPGDQSVGEQVKAVTDSRFDNLKDRMLMEFVKLFGTASATRDVEEAISNGIEIVEDNYIQYCLNPSTEESNTADEDLVSYVMNGTMCIVTGGQMDGTQGRISTCCDYSRVTTGEEFNKTGKLSENQIELLYRLQHLSRI